ncbi:family 78 glycoside hydrolase catalytic domain [Flagellimonas amoyensis]|uniref:alpha-L-rhamnosidase-related protein n=1 Tax=Flagellimonas amoyensis TaxID=2169401 RepID=UPI000D34ACAB|nr:family 78 glycoside hydrolase catalytic domain [Allomuricauda amoyensis]
MKLRITIAILFLALFPRVYGQLPPVFGNEFQDKVRTTEMTKVNLTAQRIVWKSSAEGTIVGNPGVLLKKGSGQVSVNEPEIVKLVSNAIDKPGILLDFGKEIYGGIRLTRAIGESKLPIKVRVRFGESAGEAMAEIGGDQNATNEHSMRDFIVELPWLGSIEVGNSGFRFVRLDLVDPNVTLPLKSVEAIFQFRDIPYLGSFESSDSRLDSIWKTGAYTVHLNMQDFLWDGIKRDRLVWVGDMHPEVMTINTVFGKNEVVPKSLDFARDQHASLEWMNGISSYSMWWLIIHKEWYDAHGDMEYLMEQQPYILKLLAKFESYIDSKGVEKLDGHRFLDWPTSESPKEIHAGLQALMALTFDSGADIMEVMDLPKKSAHYKEVANKLRDYLPKEFSSKQAGALVALGGLGNATEIHDRILKKDGPRNMSTFYGYYILEAMSKAGAYETAIDLIKDYWGGMLDLGATTFWEDFNVDNMEYSGRIDELNAEDVNDIHGDFGDYCYIGYRHSLCHGWASGPTAWLSRHVLGVKVKDGGNTVVIEPHLGNLEWVKGTYPTKFGELKISHKKNKTGTVHTEIVAPNGLKVIQK